jgi:tRNA-splicing ligase RtcB (3'-phosphate/5'-hydroxy nucleic acid ligase)
MVVAAGRLERIDAYRWRLPTTYRAGMRVPGIVYASEKMLPAIESDQGLDQVANVAMLPGIVRASFAMPDIHSGYGFPIGGVAAFRLDDGIVAAGGVGYDINCGTRILRTDLSGAEVRPMVDRLSAELFLAIPSGLGSGGRRESIREIDDALRGGAGWAVGRGMGWPEDLESTESGGVLDGADVAAVSERAKDRGRTQLGSLGSGNHFLEVQCVDAIFDPDVAKTFGIDVVGQVVVFLHTGSRGLGHQVCDDHLRVMGQAAARYGIVLPDRQLACAPFRSAEAQRYLAAMRAAANFAWANRQCITSAVRNVFARVFGRDARDLRMHLLYDVAHNIATVEEHAIDGDRADVLVHRKGATRAFPAGHTEVPVRYRSVGQPVLIPGDMGRYSFLLVGTERAMAETFGSVCHGAGRLQSRHAARRLLGRTDLVAALRAQGIVVRARNPRLLAEEASQAYKDVADVVAVCEGAGIARKVARMRPLAVIKG